MEPQLFAAGIGQTEPDEPLGVPRHELNGIRRRELGSNDEGSAAELRPGLTQHHEMAGLEFPDRTLCRLRNDLFSSRSHTNHSTDGAEPSWRATKLVRGTRDPPPALLSDRHSAQPCAGARSLVSAHASTVQGVL
jgi:hypothetical protein